MQLRQQLQSRVAHAGLLPEVSLAANLMMQHLAVLLSEAGACADARSGAAVQDYSMAVCESLQAALWLLHGRLASSPMQGLSVGAVVRQWVADLNDYVSSPADVAVMKLIAFV
jgi:hypothetical protein